MTKYWVVKGSATAHCCFTHSVVCDRYVDFDKEKKWPEEVGEFFDAENAKLFAKAHELYEIAKEVLQCHEEGYHLSPLIFSDIRKIIQYINEGEIHANR